MFVRCYIVNLVRIKLHRIVQVKTRINFRKTINYSNICPMRGCKESNIHGFTINEKSIRIKRFRDIWGDILTESTGRSSLFNWPLKTNFNSKFATNIHPAAPKLGGDTVSGCYEQIKKTTLLRSLFTSMGGYYIIFIIYNI